MLRMTKLNGLNIIDTTKGQSNGIAGLNSESKIPSNQVPSLKSAQDLIVASDYAKSFPVWSTNIAHSEPSVKNAEITHIYTNCISNGSVLYMYATEGSGKYLYKTSDLVTYELVDSISTSNSIGFTVSDHYIAWGPVLISKVTNTVVARYASRNSSWAFLVEYKGYLYACYDHHTVTRANLSSSPLRFTTVFSNSSKYLASAYVVNNVLAIRTNVLTQFLSLDGENFSDEKALSAQIRFFKGKYWSLIGSAYTTIATSIDGLTYTNTSISADIIFVLNGYLYVIRYSANTKRTSDGVTFVDLGVNLNSSNVSYMLLFFNGVYIVGNKYSLDGVTFASWPRTDNMYVRVVNKELIAYAVSGNHPILKYDKATDTWITYRNANVRAIYLGQFVCDYDLYGLPDSLLIYN